MEKLELVAAGGISPVRTDPDLVLFAAVVVENKYPKPSFYAPGSNDRGPSFYAPGSNDRGHIVFILSVCLSVCLFVCL